jgi:hypothetical protein
MVSRHQISGIGDLSAIASKETIKYLELWQIRGLSRISVVSTLSGLQYLFLQALSNVTEIPNLSKLRNLCKIRLDTMKGLKDANATTTAHALEEFIHLSAQNIQPEQYRALLDIPSLQTILVRFGSQQKNQEFDKPVVQSGKTLYKSPFVPFVFH